MPTPDGNLEDIVVLEDSITSSTVSAIAAKLQEPELERLKRKPLENFSACAIQGRRGATSCKAIVRKAAQRMW
jgi:hypothetical protein